MDAWLQSQLGGDPVTLSVVASVLGNWGHICKKGAQEANEQQCFLSGVERWIFSKPIHTLSALVMGIVAAGSLSGPVDTPWIETFSQSFLAGYFSDSLLNRADKV